jgi:hypothetical protein
MVVIVGVVGGVRGGVAAAVAIGDELGAETDRGVHPGTQVGRGVAIGFDQDDVAQRADGGGHVDVEGFLDIPACAGRASGQRACLAILVNDGEAAGPAGGQAPGGPVGREVGGCVGIVVGVHHRYGLATARDGRGQGVRALQARGAVPIAGRGGVWARGGLQIVPQAGADQRQAGHVAGARGSAGAVVVRVVRGRSHGLGCLRHLDACSGLDRSGGTSGAQDAERQDRHQRDDDPDAGHTQAESFPTNHVFLSPFRNYGQLSLTRVEHHENVYFWAI